MIDLKHMVIVNNPNNVKIIAIPVFKIDALVPEGDGASRVKGQSRIVFVSAMSAEQACAAYSEHLAPGEFMGAAAEVPSAAEMAMAKDRAV